MRDDPSVVALVARAAEDDHAAWDELVERYAPLVWAICTRYQLGRDDVEDVAQNVWLLLVSGTLELRDPDGRHPLRAGDLVRFPLGPDGAHQVTNRGDEPARLLMWSDRSWPEIAVYPDSDKIGAYLPGEYRADEVMVRRADAGTPYWDGEPKPD